jgi:ribonuclease HII
MKLTTKSARLKFTGSETLPNLALEKELLKKYNKVAFIDECGRGSVGGGCYVGVVVLVKNNLEKTPPKVNDSKKLTPTTRSNLVKEVENWVHSYGVGSASAAEIDKYGINSSLLLAAFRGYDLNSVNYIVLDGKHNWLTDYRCLQKLPPLYQQVLETPSQTLIKGDSSSIGLACASIIGKVKHDIDIDKLMEVSPEFQWSSHKGYPTKKHKELIRKYGLTNNHRKTWNLN